MGVLSLLSTTALLCAAAPRLVLAAPRAATQTLDLGDLGLPPAKRQDSSLTGYLGAFFLGDDPDVYFYLSEGNDAISLSALNGGSPVLVPTVGTGGVRDPAIVKGGGDEEGNKWYIVGTDLDISKVRETSYKEDLFPTAALVIQSFICPDAQQTVHIQTNHANHETRRLGMHRRGRAPGVFSCGKVST